MGKNIRLLSILERLSKEASLSVKEQALFFGVSQKSIQNDFQVLNEYFGDKLVKRGESYILLNTDIFSKIFKSNPQSIKHFLHMLSTVDTTFYETFMSENSDLLKSLNFITSPIYQIENSPYEKLKTHSLELIEELELAITNREYINITHHKPHEKIWTFKECQALKILYLEENWYLAVNTLQNYHKENSSSCFRLMRISFIEKIAKRKTEPKKFHTDNIEKLKAEQYLHLLQTPFSKIQNTSYKVILQISAFASTYFKAKKYLKSQRELKTLENGAVFFEFTITDDMEVIPLIQQWIPHLKVVEPLRIKSKIEESMKEFMKRV